MKSVDRTDVKPLILSVIQSKLAATGATIPALARRDATACFTDRRTPRTCSGGTKICEKAAIQRPSAALPIRLSADLRQALSLERHAGYRKEAAEGVPPISVRSNVIGQRLRSEEAVQNECPFRSKKLDEAHSARGTFALKEKENVRRHA